MSNYQDLMQQAQALLTQAEQLRRSERATALAEIKHQMKVYQLSADDLNARPQPNPKTSKSEPKYRGPNNALWSGGPGRRPTWVKEALAAGQDIEQYRI